MRIALLGTGRMATHLGRHMMTAGHQLTVWNRTASRTAPLVEAGASAVASAAEAVADAELVVTVLFGPPSVRETVINPDLLGEGALWLDVTTVGPEDAEFQATWALHKGVRYVAGPVLGSMAPAAEGVLGALLGGSPEDIAAVREVVLLWGDAAKVRELPTAREAAAGKLVANLALGVAAQGVAEALTFAADVGLDRAVALAVLAGSVLAPVVAAKKDKIAERDFDEADFTALALIKDIDLVLSATLGLHAVQATRDALEAAIDEGRGNADFSVIIDG